MRPKHFWVDLEPSDADDIFQAQQPNGAATLNGVKVTGGVAYCFETAFSKRAPNKGVTGSAALFAARLGNGMPQGRYHWARTVLLSSAGNWSGVTFTVVGYNQDGHYVSEAITGPNAGTSEGSVYFRRIDSITTSGTVASDVTAGFGDIVTSNTIPVTPGMNVGPRVIVDIAGTINYDVHGTPDDILLDDFMIQTGFGSTSQLNATNYGNIYWIDVQAGTAAVSNNVVARGLRAIRVQINSYTDGAELNLHILPERDEE